MANVKGVYDGYQFDFSLPQDRQVTGEEILNGTAQALGQKPKGAPVIRRATGDLEYVGANDRVQMQSGDSVTVLDPFVTAGGYRPRCRAG